MKLYKDSNNNVFAYEDDKSQDHLIGDKIAITKQEADELIAIKQKAEFDLLPYDVKRASEYPPIADYLDGIVKNDQAQIDAYILACQAVKAKYPKG
jgi:hypothetical protein